MTITVTKQVLLDGPTKSQVKLHIVSDDAAEATNQSLLDVSTLRDAPTTVNILSLLSMSSDMDIDLHWDATANVDITTLPVGETAADYNHFGGLVNNAGAGVTGDILFSTRGAAADSEATIILELRK